MFCSLAINTISQAMSRRICHFLTTFVDSFPTNNGLLINFRLTSDAEILFNEHRRSMRNRRQNVQKRVCNVYVFQRSFHFACHRCWLGLDDKVCCVKRCVEDNFIFVCFLTPDLYPDLVIIGVRELVLWKENLNVLLESSSEEKEQEACLCW